MTLVLVLLTALSTVFIVRAVDDQKRKLIPTEATKRDQALDMGAVLDAPHIVFRSMALGPTYGMMAAVPLKEPQGMRSASDLECDRVYATPSAGVCLSSNRGAITTYKGYILNSRLSPTSQIPVNGSPSRARLSTDGTYSATTVFTAGHGYGTIGFSTETVINNRLTGWTSGNLEKTFTVMIGGKHNTAADLNIWGVSFIPGDNPTGFYATVAEGGKTWLAKGDLTTRTLTSIHPDAECPSISPDGRTIVYKRRDGSRIKWRYHALDLRTGKEWDLAEPRSIDDQAEWLDNNTVIYGLQRPGTGQADVWAVSIRGRTKPKILIPDAFSPAVVRTAAKGSAPVASTP